MSKLLLIFLVIICLIAFFYISLSRKKKTWQVKWVKHGDIILWTESSGNPKNPAVLLISGAGAPAKFWTDNFCKTLISAGYFVIRFDNRDIGLSSAVDFEKHPYTTLDMAKDVIAILDAYCIQKANIVGHSMGGRIVQLLALDYPQRLLNMTSISVGTVGELGTPPKEIMDVLLANKPTQNFESSLPGFMKSWEILNGKIPVDKNMAQAYTKDLYQRSKHKVGVAWNHIKAQKDFRNFASELKTITVPALFIHGELDPLIPVQAGIATAEIVPNAKMEIIPNMGHMIFDKGLEQQIAKILINFFRAAEFNMKNGL